MGQTDDVKGQIIVPRQTVEPNASVPSFPSSLTLIPRQALPATFAQLIPLIQQRRDVQPDVGLKLKDALLGEDVGDNLALTSVFRPGARVEESAVDGDEGVVKVGLERAVAVRVDDLQGVGVCHRNVVRRDAREGTCYFSIGCQRLLQVRAWWLL